jgi:SAM-dependent methyltransferase
VSIDWGVGRYEHTAAKLEAAAKVAVDRAAPRAGERMLDLGCGTGNAALLLARRGTDVVAVDPAARLLEVAADRAAEAGLAIEFTRGEAAALPLADASIDAVVSVFALIFAADPQAAMAEVARVLRPSGRVVFTAWLPQGVIARIGQLAAQLVREATGSPAAPPRFPWHDPDAVARLVAPYGLSVRFDDHPLVFTAPSPQDFVEDDEAHHPMAVTERRALEAAGGDAAAFRARLVEVATDGNEDGAAFRATSHYRVFTLTR